MTTVPPPDGGDDRDERENGDGTERPGRRDEHDDAHYDALFADIVARWNTPGPDVTGSTSTRAAGEVRSPEPVESDPRGDIGRDAGPGRADPRDAGGPLDGEGHGSPTPPRDPGDEGSGGGAGSAHAPRVPLDPSGLAWRGSAGSGESGWRVHVPPPDDEDDTYTPPPPAPLPTGDLTFWGALIGLVAGPIWLVYLVIAAPYGPKLPFVAAVALFLGGFALLVSRLPRRRSTPEDDDGDDGAVV